MSTEEGLRRALLGLGALVCLGLMAELVLIEHYNDLVQWLPFALSGLVIACIVAIARTCTRWVIVTTRVALLLTAVGAAFGVYEHLEHNFVFAAEIRPNAELAALLLPTLLGASPALAPGALAVAAMMAIAATWRHPALSP